MGGNEIDGRILIGGFTSMNIFGAGKSPADMRYPTGTPPEIANVIAKSIIPLTPQGWEPADLIAAGSNIPWFSNQLYLSQHRVLLHCAEKRALKFDIAFTPGERSRQIESKTIYVHLCHPISE